MKSNNKIKVIQHKTNKQSRTPSPPQFPLISYSFQNEDSQKFIHSARTDPQNIQNNRSFLRVATDRSLFKKNDQISYNKKHLPINKIYLPPIQTPKACEKVVYQFYDQSFQQNCQPMQKSLPLNNKITASCCKLIPIYKQVTFKKNFLLILDINAIGFLHESYFTPSSSDDSNDEEVIKITNLLFKMVRIEYEQVPISFFYYHNLKDQLTTLNKIFHIILILPEIREIYLKTLLNIQILFDAVYLIERKPCKIDLSQFFQDSFLIDYTNIVKELGELKKIICITSLETNYQSNQNIKDVLIDEQMNILFPYVSEIQTKQIIVQKMKFKEMIKVLLRFTNSGILHEVNDGNNKYMLKDYQPSFISRNMCQSFE